MEFYKTLFEDNDPEVVSYFADESSPEELVQELRGRGLFNSSKIVVLKHLERNAPGSGRQLSRYQEAIEKYLEDPEPGVLLFMMDEDHPYRNSRQTGSMAQSVEERGGDSIIFWEPFDDSLRDYVRSAFTDASVSITPPAVQALLERTRGKYSRIKREVEKLLNSSGSTVNESDVESVVTREEAADGLQALKDDLADKDPGRVMTDLGDLWRRGEAPPKIFHVLFSFLDSLRTVKQLQSNGYSMEDALSELGIPTNKSVTKLYKRATRPGGLTVPRDFYEDSYETSKTAKYSGRTLARRAVEIFILRLLQGNR
ncbi:MAG: DNA polymerase III subunit delta [bacterium]